jgi:hypothetical protein
VPRISYPSRAAEAILRRIAAPCDARSAGAA